VVVDTPLGPDVGRIVVAPGSVVHRDEMVPVCPTLRLTTEEDMNQGETLSVRETESLMVARKKARERGLVMKFSRTRFGLDAHKITIGFTSEERVELRNLYRGLGEALQARVELKPVGPREEAKNIGGIGRCGNVTCCSLWLDKFELVSIRIAKEQALPVSAENLAGQCGRLKCCLRFEYEQYRAVNKLMPRIGDRVVTPEGGAKVIVGHALKKTVSVVLDQRGPDDFVRTEEYGLADIQRMPREQQPQRPPRQRRRQR
jgi:cell fate regulator YaaT (PSP1 superfamily)